MKIRPGGRGDVTETHVDWRIPTGAPYVSSLLYYDGLLYMANGSGIFTCVDAATGERVWRERLGGAYSASPLAADGRIYFFSETGETIVLASGRDPVVLARKRPRGPRSCVSGDLRRPDLRPHRPPSRRHRKLSKILTPTCP